LPIALAELQAGFGLMRVTLGEGICKWNAANRRAQQNAARQLAAFSNDWVMQILSKADRFYAALLRNRVVSLAKSLRLY